MRLVSVSCLLEPFLVFTGVDTPLFVLPARFSIGQTLPERFTAPLAVRFRTLCLRLGLRVWKLLLVPLRCWTHNDFSICLLVQLVVVNDAVVHHSHKFSWCDFRAGHRNEKMSHQCFSSVSNRLSETSVISSTSSSDTVTSTEHELLGCWRARIESSI